MKWNSLVAVLIFFTGIFPRNGQGQDNPIVAWVADIPVYAEELDLFIAEQRAGLIREVLNEYDISFDAHFWEYQLEGQTTAERLIERAMNHLLPFKVEQLLLLETGLMPEWEWTAFLNGYHQYIQYQQSAAQQGNMGFGPQQMSLINYYRHYFRSRQTKLENQLRQTARVGPSLSYQHFIEQLQTNLACRWAAPQPTYQYCFNK